MYIQAIILLGCGFLAFGQTDQVGENERYHKAYYDNGNTRSEGWIDKGRKTGYWRFYHPNGKLSEQGEYQQNQRVNYWYFYATNGQKAAEGHYQYGHKVNWWLFYDKNGRINHKCQLRNGIKNGYCLMYHDTKLTSAEKYKNGKKIKEWFSFSSFRRENKLSDLK